MRRLQRRVGNSHVVPEASSKTMTFDRNTFVECSRRMKGLVPTLSRKQKLDTGKSTKVENHNSVPASTPGSSQQYAEQFKYSRSSSTDTGDTENEKTSPGIEFFDIILDRKMAEEKTGGIDDDGDEAFDTVTAFPVNASTVNDITHDDTSSRRIISSAESIIQGSHVHSSPHEEKKSTERRPIWLTTLTYFVSVMTNIGDNVGVASYPTH